MAVTAPVAPTPPVAPTVPKVTLQGAGSVTESTKPQDRHWTQDEKNENAAREAVAKGSGPLSKTTVSKEQKNETDSAAPPQNSRPNQTDVQNPPAESNQAVANQPRQPVAEKQPAPQVQRRAEAETPSEGLYGEYENKSQEAAVTAPLRSYEPEGASKHGTLYIASSVVLGAVLAVMIFKFFFQKSAPPKNIPSPKRVAKEKITPKNTPNGNGKKSRFEVRV